MSAPLRGRAAPRRLGIAALCCVLAGLAATAAAQATPAWRALYQGSAGQGNAVLDLSLQGDSAVGRLLLPARSEVLEGKGTSATSGDIHLDLKTSGGADEGVLQIRRSLAPNDDGKTVQGRLTLGGSTVPVSLVRIARYVRWDVREGPIQLDVSYPHFVTSDTSELNAELAPRAHARIDTFLAQGRRADATGTLFHAWELISTTRLEGLSGSFVSLLTQDYAFTGGAHGNYTYLARSWQLGAPAPRRLTLAGLFRPGTPFMARIVPLVLADLRAQNATWVVQGQVTTLSQQDLELFSLTPAGLAFTFPPYAMGPYVEGTFTVVVPYRKIIDLAVTNGALQAFAGQAR